MSDIWVNRAPTADSPYYPFRKVVDDTTLAGCEDIPYILSRYLMDLPDATGYQPPSDNKFPRARLKKILYWDGPRPLDQPLPTTDQTLSILFDPQLPDKPPDKDRGYRFYPQNMTQQSMAQSKSLVRVYLSDGQTITTAGNAIFRQDVIFDVLVNVGIEGNMGTTNASRAYAIVQCIKEAISGVNFGGTGHLAVRRITKIDDERTFMGYKIYCYLDWTGDAPNPNYI